MDNSQNEKIIKELQRITKLLLLATTKDMKQVNKIYALSDVGFLPKEIADLLGTTAGTVSNALTRKRTKGALNDE